MKDIPTLGHYHSFPMRFAKTKRQKPASSLTTKAKDKLDTIRQNPINQQKKQCGDRCHYKYSQCSSAGFTPRRPGNPVDFLTDLSNKLCGRHSSHRYLPIQVLINQDTAINTLRFPWVSDQANGQHLMKSILAIFTLKGWSHILG
jgi:hypothetical protein